jgi:hypothetical protein
MVTGTEKYYQARAQDYDKPERQADLVRLREWLPGKASAIPRQQIPCPSSA